MADSPEKGKAERLIDNNIMDPAVMRLMMKEVSMETGLQIQKLWKTDLDNVLGEVKKVNEKVSGLETSTSTMQQTKVDEKNISS